MIRHYLLLILLIIALPFALTAYDTIFINENQYIIDHELKLVISNSDLELINGTSAESNSYVQLDGIYKFMTAVDNIELGTPYSIKKTSLSNTYSLYFTELPLIQIVASEDILDEADIPAYFTMIESNGNLTQSDIGIQFRGGWTQSLPKKSMEIEFWTDPQESDHQDIALLGMRNDDDWNLQAMYNEPLRIRSVTNFELWQMMDTLYYQAEEPEASNTVQLEYAELFIDDRYRGVYAVGEKIDRKQLKLKSHNASIRGELYKGYTWGATTLGSLPPYDNNSNLWGGFEHKYPNEEIDWFNLYSFSDIVINADDDMFYDKIFDQFDMENAVNYFIFLNILRAEDNTGKNIYVAKYNTDEPYFYVPWDLDGTLGTAWYGGKATKYDDILLNGMYERLMDEPCFEDRFRKTLKEKWLALRATTLSDDSLIELLSNNHTILIENGVYERESLAWSEYVYNPSDFGYMTNWINNRTSYLDEQFGIECEYILNSDEVTNSQLLIYPNPTTGVINIRNDSGTQLDVTVYNQVGQLLLKSRLIEIENTLSLHNLNSGIYTVNITSDKFIEVRKVLVK